MNAGIITKNHGISPSVAIANDFKARVLADNGIYEGHNHLISIIKMLRHKGIYDRASIILTPNGYKSGKLYTLKSDNGSTDFTFTGGGGSRIDSNGDRVPVLQNMPKIDYTDGYPEILLERASTNVLLNSETLSSQIINVNAQSYVLSFYGAGTVTINENSPIVLTGTNINTRVYTSFVLSAGSKNITVTGEVKYAQMEPMNNPTYYNFPTTWIPTGSAAASRSVSSLLKSGLSSLVINQMEGTVFFEVKRKGRGNLLRIDDNTNTNSIRFFNVGSMENTIEVRYTKNGQESLNGTTTIPLNANNRFALRYNSAKCDIYVNGLFYASLNTSGLFSNNLNRISFLGTESTVNRIQYFVYIPYEYTPDELIRLSSI